MIKVAVLLLKVLFVATYEGKYIFFNSLTMQQQNFTVKFSENLDIYINKYSENLEINMNLVKGFVHSVQRE